MNKQTETTITVLAAVFVLLSAMFDVRITLMLAIIFLVALTIYHSIQARKHHGNTDEI
jgi:L-asparagine transporter-like permease